MPQSPGFLFSLQPKTDEDMQKNTILTITGSDSTGGSGVQADIRTIASLGCTPLSAITSITVQNTLGIQEFYDLPPHVVGGQIDAIVNDVQPQAVKVGMVRRAETLEVVVEALRHYHPQLVICAPVLFSSRGDQLMDEDTLRLARRRLFPLCTAIVMNKGEARRIMGDGIWPNVYFIDDEAFHGLANGFSSSLAAYLCSGLALDDAVEKARDYSRHQIGAASALQGRGARLYNDFARLVRLHCGQNSDVASYASQLNVSGAYLGQVCRRVAGRSPKGIIDDCLLQEIEWRLSGTADNIQQIAIALGFSSQAHLSRFFKKMAGISPSEYRARNCQGGLGC